MSRCSHEPIDLFDRPPAGAQHEAILFFLSGWTRLRWVICRKCGATGYWGGYGAKRRVRWGYGDNTMPAAAQHHNVRMKSCP